MTLKATAILDALVSHAASLGLFERVNQHEPINAPGSGLTCAMWADTIGPVPAGSGLRATSARIVWYVRIYTSWLSDPADTIDPLLMAAVDELMAAYSGDFTLGGLVRNVDLLGQSGISLTAAAGYIEHDSKVFRVFTVTVPVIVNDAWEQVP